jgi:hypothetical protein
MPKYPINTQVGQYEMPEYAESEVVGWEYGQVNNSRPKVGALQSKGESKARDWTIKSRLPLLPSQACRATKQC